MIREDLEYFEKYRPLSVEDMVLPNRIKNIASLGLKKNYIFHSSPGTGKTTLARILIQNHSHIIIDGKLGVDVLREKVRKFCTESNIFDNSTERLKIVYFEEFDRASKALQEELKSFTEKYSHNVRFLATCNNINSFDPAIVSRFTFIDFAPSMDEAKLLRKDFYNKIIHNLTKDNIKVEESLVKDALIKKYPDIRSVWNYIEANINLGNTDSHIVEDSTLYDKIFSDSCSDLELWDYLYANWIERYNTAFMMLGKPLVNHIRNNRKDYISNIGATISLLTEYTDVRLANAPDPFLTLYSLVIGLKKIYTKNK